MFFLVGQHLRCTAEITLMRLSRLSSKFKFNTYLRSALQFHFFVKDLRRSMAVLCYAWIFLWQAIVNKAAIPSIDLNPFTKSNTEFGLDIYKKAILYEPSDNIIFSPLSISLSLGLLRLGLKGSSLLQLNSALHLDQALHEQYNSIFQNIRTTLLQGNQSYSFRIVNKIYGEQSFSILPQFLDDAKTFYDAEVEKVDFINDPAGVTSLINTWVSNQTEAKISDLIGPDVLSSFTRLVLINAIHFKEGWLNRFLDAEEEPFYLNNDETTKVQLMKYRTTKLNIAINSEIHFRALEIPYLKDIAFFIVLPDLDTSLSNVETSLTGEVLNSLHFSERIVNVWLPRFKLDIELQLKQVLMDLGITDVFTQDVADLSGINGRQDLHVSNALHKAFIELNEEGTEAAAATALVIGLRSMREPSQEDIMDFRADHPFFFYLKDLRTNTILFMGRFMKP